MTIELPAGATVGGKYRIEKLLGRGAVGTVYGAEQIETGKRVALKCVDTSYALDPAAAERVVREAQAAARVRHAHVVDIYDVGRDDKLLFLVMEYLEGETLSSVLARNDLPVHKMIARLLPAMRGVAEAHRQGVVHRDIKPENIFYARQVDSGEPVAKVLDFGISKLDARGQPLRALTADGYALGTPGYMSFEQVIGEKTIDGRADVYAFGAILYEVLTGHVPHSAEDFGSLARHFLTQPVPTPIELGADVPADLSALVMWAIERDREQRVSSMESLIRELEPFALRPLDHSTSSKPAKPQGRALGGRTLVGPWGMNAPTPKEVAAFVAREAAPNTLPPTTVEEVLQLKRSRKQRTRGLWLGLGIAAVLALGLLALSFWSAPEPPAAASAAPIEHKVSAATRVEPAVAPEPELPAATRGEAVEPAPSASAALPAKHDDTAAAPKAPEPSAVVQPAHPKAHPATEMPATAKPKAPAPSLPAATPRPQSTVKRRDFGIY